MKGGYQEQCTTVHSGKICGCHQGCNWVSYFKKAASIFKDLAVDSTCRPHKLLIHSWLGLIRGTKGIPAGHHTDQFILNQHHGSGGDVKLQRCYQLLQGTKMFSPFYTIEIQYSFCFYTVSSEIGSMHQWSSSSSEYYRFHCSLSALRGHSKQIPCLIPSLDPHEKTFTLLLFVNFLILP